MQITDPTPNPLQEPIVAALGRDEFFLPKLVTTQSNTEAAASVISCDNVISLDAYRKILGRSKVTVWRYRRNGWLKTVNFLGKLYVTREAIADFEAKITSGEFAKVPHGCAAREVPPNEREASCEEVQACAAA